MPTSTLALGQASYELLEALDGDVSPQDLESKRIVETIRAERRGGFIDQLQVGVREGFTFGGGDGLGSIQSLNILDSSRGLIFNDSDISGVNVNADSGNPNGNLPAPAADPPLSSANSAANINILANARQAQIGLGEGDNRLNAARDLTGSSVSAQGGNDTVRIGGATDGSFVSLGGGDDQFTAGRVAADLDLDMGDGNDNALFLGTLEAGTGPSSQYNPVTNYGVEQTPEADGSNFINMGEGDDKVTFLGGIQNHPVGALESSPGVNGYEVQLGAGNDTAVFGRGSTSNGFVLNTGTGSDAVTLGRVTENAVIDLGWDYGGISASGDSVILGVGADLSNSVVRSGQSHDTLQIAGTITDTSLDLGWGQSLVNVDGAALFGSTEGTTVWDLGSGDDQLVFGETSILESGGLGSGLISLGEGADLLDLSNGGGGDGNFGAIEFDLGNDEDIDTIVFGLDYSGFTISNFGSNDVLFIGNGSYGYGYSFLNEWANDDDLFAFQGSNNVIWSQVEDGGSHDQVIMTLQEEMINEGLFDANSNEVRPSEELIEAFSDEENWVAAGEAPMSSYEQASEQYSPHDPHETQYT